MHRSALVAVLACLAVPFALTACGGGGGSGKPASNADVEAQVRQELPQQFHLDENQPVLQRLSLAYGGSIRITDAKCTPKAGSRFECSADGVGANWLGGYKRFTVGVTADCSGSRCSLSLEQ